MTLLAIEWSHFAANAAATTAAMIDNAFTHQVSLKSKKLFVDGRTDVQTDIWDPLYYVDSEEST